MTWEKFFFAMTVGSLFGWAFLGSSLPFPIIAPFTFFILIIIQLFKYNQRTEAQRKKIF